VNQVAPTGSPKPPVGDLTPRILSHSPLPGPTGDP
jgi:hypothetical protein